jgi:ABC-type maltose transport system permease subunit
MNDKKIGLGTQILLQIFLIFMLVVVMFPVLWIVSMAIDPRGISRPSDLTLIPPGASFDSFSRLLNEPFSNLSRNVYFSDMLGNSLFTALGTAVFTVALGASAAYAFSRFKFIGREAGMLGFIVLLMLPSTGTLIPLYVLLSRIEVHNIIVALAPALFIFALAGVLAWIGLGALNRFLIKPPKWVKNLRAVRWAVVIVELIVLFALIYGFLMVQFQQSDVYADFSEDARDAQEEVIDARESLQTAQDSLTSNLERIEDARAELAAAEALLAEYTEDEIAQAQADLEAAEAKLDADPENEELAAEVERLDAIANAPSNVERRREILQRREERVEDVRAELVELQAELEAARAEADAAWAEVTSATQPAFTRLLPYAVLFWALGLIGSVLTWGALKVAYDRFLSKNWDAEDLNNRIKFAVVLLIAVLSGLMAFHPDLGGPDGDTQPLRVTLFGLAVAYASGSLPFAIWQLKGYFDTIPRELEEAALVDGATLFSTFFVVILPLSLPALAITILFSFMTGWTEFLLAWMFLEDPQRFTLAMGLRAMQGGQNQPAVDWNLFAAMSILMSIPVLVVFYGFQRWIVSGLTLGSVKG